MALDRRPEGEVCYLQALAQQRKSLGDHLRDVRVTLIDLSKLRSQDGDYDEAVTLLREALEIGEQAYPEGHPKAVPRFVDMANLGQVLACQPKAQLPTDRERALALFQEAEPLLSAGLTGMLKDPRNGNLENERLALKRTVTIFEFWHNVAPDRGWGERAAEWQAELEKLDGS